MPVRVNDAEVTAQEGSTGSEDRAWTEGCPSPVWSYRAWVTRRTFRRGKPAAQRGQKPA